MTYIDGFVIPVPVRNRQAYIDMAARCAPIFKEHGALAVVEAWGDDIPEGKVTDFRTAVKAEADEAVCFSWIVWPDKATRDAGQQKVMADPRMAPDGEDELPFSGARLIYGGFTQVVEA